MAIYQEEDVQMGEFYHTIPKPSLKVTTKKGAVWLIACRILDISPAAWARMLVNEYKAELEYSKGDGGYYHELLIKKWPSQADARRYKNMLNKVARQKDFHV